MRIGVVGAGPAGLLFSSLIRSHEVTVYEEHTRVGWPPHCTGLVSEATARRLASYAGRGILGQTYFSARIRRGRRVAAEIMGEPLAVRVRRPCLEERLAEKTLEAGHRVLLGQRVEALDPLSGELRSGRGAEELDLLVVSAGSSAWLIRGAACGPPPTILRGLQAVVATSRRPEPGVFDVVYGSPVSRRMFGWIVPLDGRRVLAGTADQGRPYAGLAELLRILDHIYGVSGVDYYYGGRVLRGPPCRRHVLGKALWLGDAAGMVKPYTGGGLYAISITAPLAARLVEKGVPEQYAEAAGWLAGKLRLQRVLAKAAWSLGPEASSAALGAVWSSPHGRAALGKVDYDSHEELLSRLVPILPIVALESLIYTRLNHDGPT